MHDLNPTDFGFYAEVKDQPYTGHVSTQRWFDPAGHFAFYMEHDGPRNFDIKLWRWARGTIKRGRPESMQPIAQAIISALDEEEA